MASDIYNALEKREVWVRKGKAEVKRLVVEGYQFENKERVMKAIHDLATRLQFELKKQARKRTREKVLGKCRIPPTSNVYT